jgi:hypothetical protein
MPPASASGSRDIVAAARPARRPERTAKEIPAPVHGSSKPAASPATSTRPRPSGGRSLVDQRHTCGARVIRVAADSRNYREHGSYASDRRWRAGLA